LIDTPTILHTAHDAHETACICARQLTLVNCAVYRPVRHELGEKISCHNDLALFDSVLSQAFPIYREVDGRWFDELGGNADQLEAEISGAPGTGIKLARHQQMPSYFAPQSRSSA
jgi:hypothetical protein